MTLHGVTRAKQIEADVQVPVRSKPTALFVRLRHPAGARIRSVAVNGRPWTDFDPDKEWVRINAPMESRYKIVASYE